MDAWAWLNHLGRLFGDVDHKQHGIAFAVDFQKDGLRRPLGHLFGLADRFYRLAIDGGDDIAFLNALYNTSPKSRLQRSEIATRIQTALR